MEHSTVYLGIHFLLYLRDAPISERQIALANIIPSQVERFCVIATRIVNGVVSLASSDASLIQQGEILLSTLASERVPFATKKAFLKHFQALVPVLLRTPYLIQVILDEIRTTREE